MAVDVDDLVARIETDGYAIVENAIEPSLIDALTADLARLEARLGTTPGDNTFEGEDTTRVYNLLAHGGPWLDLPVHPVVLPVAEAVLGGEILVSTVSSIAIAPGETAQPIHTDDQVMPLARPHVPTVCNSMWALTDFTEANGATVIAPGSNHWPGFLPDVPDDATCRAAMPAGSALLYSGKVIHGGGPNSTADEWRVGLHAGFCCGWLRAEENHQLTVPLDVARELPERAQYLLGFRSYDPEFGGRLGLVDYDDAARVL